MLIAAWIGAALLNHSAATQEALLPWWQQADEHKVGHYWIKSDLDAQACSALARHLNLMYDQYAQRLAGLPLRAPQDLKVLLFSERRDYVEVLRLRFGVDGRDTGGMFFVTPLGSALALWTEELPRLRVQHVLQHEGFHQFAYSRFGDDLPVWLNEGLAELFGQAVPMGRSLLLGQATPRVISSIQEAIERGTFIPFARMLPMKTEEWKLALEEGSSPVLYAQAWSMVHFLVYGDGGRYGDALDDYLRLLNEAVPAEEAFVRVFGPNIQAFENRWKAHVAALRPGALLTALEQIEVLAAGALELSRDGVIPGSLEELQRHLSDIGFTHALRWHGVGVELRGGDPALYAIPRDELTSVQPLFVVEKLDLARLTLREQRLEEQHPSPPAIGTLHLAPRELRIKWMRDPASGQVQRYEIVLEEPR